MDEHRPAYAWLTDLQKAKIDGIRGIRPKATISDLIDRVNDPKATSRSIVPTSPRSVEACFRLGIDPVELLYKPANVFQTPGEAPELAQFRFDHHEALRQERIKLLQQERQRLVEMDDPQSKKASSNRIPKEKVGSDIVEKERQRLEVLKRRQERELNQMMAHETQRQTLLDKQQQKLDAMEKRASELRHRKALHDAKWRAQQRERELLKLGEEEERERQAKRMAQERFHKEQEQQRVEKQEAKKRQKEAFRRQVHIDSYR
ncbi:hypothetical protein BSKO_01707 [Bryopsis sp. KO-2023]|nr:hypothetical protein BSKO_01707 [Bryopsis sp. KO-2023]